MDKNHPKDFKVGEILNGWIIIRVKNQNKWAKLTHK